MSRWVVLVGVLAGCAVSQGQVGIIGPTPDVLGTKLLRSRVTGRSCRIQILGVETGAGPPDLREALAEIIAKDPEGDVILDADIRSWALLTGVYNRRCVEVVGDLARAVPTIAVPGHAGHGSHGNH